MKIKNLAAPFIITLSALLASAGASAALRIGPKDAAPYLLKELTREDGMPWYDAETWLEGLNGEVQYSQAEKKIYWRKGKAAAELSLSAPYAVANGRPLGSAQQPRMLGPRLAVSERFIKESGVEFAGVEFKITLTEGALTKRVVIDPGYGGDDPGPRTVDQVQSKKITLAVAKTLAESFQREGYEVRLTRTDDVPMTNTRRAAIANNWNADIFLSIQISGDKRPLAKGFEVFYPPQPAEIDQHRWDTAQKGIAERSRKWAAQVENAAGSALSMVDRGAKELTGPLLSAVDCPAATIVLGNAGSQQEMEMLINESARRRLADALVDGANRFLAR